MQRPCPRRIPQRHNMTILPWPMQEATPAVAGQLQACQVQQMLVVPDVLPVAHDMSGGPTTNLKRPHPSLAVSNADRKAWAEDAPKPSLAVARNHRAACGAVSVAGLSSPTRYCVVPLRSYHRRLAALQVGVWFSVATKHLTIIMDIYDWDASCRRCPWRPSSIRR